MVAKPLDLAREAVARGRRLCGLYVALLNRPGALWSVLRVLAERKVNLLCVSVPSAELAEPFITAFLVGDVTGADISEEELAEELRRSPDVRSVELAEQVIDGVVVDTRRFPLTVHGMRVVMMGEAVLRPIVTGLKRHLGPAVVNTVLWHMGREMGAALGEHYREVYGTLRPRDYFLLLGARTTELGWGYTEEVEVDERKPMARLAVRDLWECAFSERSREPQSHLYRGILAGLASAVFATEMMAREIECIARGDEACTFIVKPKRGA